MSDLGSISRRQGSDLGSISKRQGSRSESNNNNTKNADDWLPITSSRNAKWYYSTFHNVTAMVGAGVLTLPYAMSQMGWYVKTFCDSPLLTYVCIYR